MAVHRSLSRLLVTVVLVATWVVAALAAAPPAPASAAPPSLLGITEVDRGAGFGCGLFGSGRVACWGVGRYGQLGNGRFASSTVPVVVSGLDDAIAVVTTWTSACALRESGAVVCWGRNDFGQLGIGTNDPWSAVPVAVTGITDAIGISAGTAWVCARRAGLTLSCWGSNTGRNIVDDADVAFVQSPTAISGLTQVVDVSLGSLHACARQVSGALRCWGANIEGQLGSGGTTPVPAGSSVAPLGLTNVTTVAAGAHHTCARGVLSGSAKIACWGSNSQNQVSSADVLAVLAPVSRGTTVVLDLDAADDTSCLVRTDGNALCWGDSPLPSGVTDTAAIAVGTDDVCVLADTTGVSCFGSDFYGSLGIAGGTIPGASPSTVIVPLPEIRPHNRVRLVDTRSSGSTVDGQYEGVGRLGSGTHTFAVQGRGGLTTSKAVAFTLTVRSATAAGAATLFRCGSPVPAVVTLRYAKGSGHSNAAIVPLVGGNVCLRLSAQAHVTLDAAASVTNAAPYTAVVPVRLADTRANGSTYDGAFDAETPIGPGTPTSVHTKGRGGLPATAASVVVNVSTTGADKAGSLAVHRCGNPTKGVSHVSVRPGSFTSSLAIVTTSDIADVCVTANVRAHVIVDAVGWFAASSATVGVAPTRIVDSRATGSTIDGQQDAFGKVAPGSVVRVDVTHRGLNRPGVSRTVVLSVTAFGPAGKGAITVWPCDAPKPGGTFALSKGQRSSTTVIVGVGGQDEVCLASSTSTHVAVDLMAAWAF